MKISRNFQDGFAAVSAIFIVVTLASLCGFIVSISNQQQSGSTQEILTLKTYWAARSGIEWVIQYNKLNNACPTATTLSVNNANVTISCNSSVFNDGRQIILYKVTATATYGDHVGGNGRVERTISASHEI